MEYIKSFWKLLGENADPLAVILAVLVPISGFLIKKFLLKPKKEQQSSPPQMGRGGNGGTASVGGNGTAIGGRGGRGGLHGSGGQGGGATVEGDGLAIGGDGGDAGVMWRPALGAPSVMEHQLKLGILGHWPVPRDEFGFFTVGRGGHGGFIPDKFPIDGFDYPIIPLLQYIRFWNPNAIDAADHSRPVGPLEFWNIIRKIDPQTANRAEAHVRHCLEEAIPKGKPAPDPYIRP